MMPAAGKAAAIPPVDSIHGSVPRIDSVEIINQNVFDLTDRRYRMFLFRLANHTHVVTRKSEIRRELLVRKGDVYDTALVNESARNLRRLNYLLKVDIGLKTGDRGERILAVTTSDRWTTSGGVSWHRSGGRNDLQLSLKENNLLGHGIFMAHDVFFMEAERTFYQVEVRDSRLGGTNLSTGIFYSDDPRMGRLLVTVGRPLYSLSQRWGAEVAYSSLQRRIDYYLAQSLVARDRLRQQSINTALQYRRGGEKAKYSFLLQYGYTDLHDRGRHWEDTAASITDMAAILPPTGVDSVFHSCHGTLRFQQIRYAVYYRLTRFQKLEDVNLGLDMRFGVGMYLPRHLTRQWQLLFNPQYTAGSEHMLAICGVAEQRWLAAGRTIRTVTEAYAKAYWQFMTNHTLVVAANYISDRLKESSQTLYLDEERGLRGYPLFYAGGESRLTANIEERLFSDLELLSVGIGGAVFADIGNIWSRGDPFRWAETRGAIGGGLRLGISRTTNAEVVRIDMSYALERGQWQISAGLGQYF